MFALKNYMLKNHDFIQFTPLWSDTSFTRVWLGCTASSPSWADGASITDFPMLLGRSVSDPMMWGIPHRIAVRMFVDILASVETAAHRVAGWDGFGGTRCCRPREMSYFLGPPLVVVVIYRDSGCCRATPVSTTAATTICFNFLEQRGSANGGKNLYVTWICANENCTKGEKSGLTWLLRRKLMALEGVRRSSVKLWASRRLNSAYLELDIFMATQLVRLAQ